MGKGRCAECHVSSMSFTDNNMHDLKLERFYKVGQTSNDMVAIPDGPIKTFTLRGIKDSRHIFMTAVFRRLLTQSSSLTWSWVPN